MTRLFGLGLAAWVGLCGTLCGQTSKNSPAKMFSFRDVGEETGLLPAANGIMGHGAGWGDVNGDGWADLYIATFHYQDTQPNLLFLNQKGHFKLADQPEVRISTRGTGVLLADLDNDGDLDLYVGSMPADKDSRLAERVGHPFAGCSLFRNEGDGNFTNISEGNGACPEAFGGRSATVLDYDGDGLLDLLVGEDPLPGYNGSKTKTSRLFHNEGNLQFKDVSREAGIPEDCAGLGVAAADLNNDGWPDMCISSTLGVYLFLNNKNGTFREAPGRKDVLAWPDAKGDDMVCGVAIGDVNGDVLPDIVLGQHFSRPWLEGVANRLYLNRGIKNGVPQFEDVTQEAGLIPLPMKGPHVEIQDFDNDGRPDIYTSIVKFADGKSHPVIFRHQGTRNGMPKFQEFALGVNDFPNDADKAEKRTGAFFEKMIADRKIIYTAPGPSCDFDQDGRIDLFLANWWAESPSMLLKNETPSGNWLDVQVEGGPGVNRQGIGAKVSIYPVGKAGDQNSLLGRREIAKGFGYASSQEAIAHLGLADRDRVDVVVEFPHGKGTITKKNLNANQRITIKP